MCISCYNILSMIYSVVVFAVFVVFFRRPRGVRGGGRRRGRGGALVQAHEAQGLLRWHYLSDVHLSNAASCALRAVYSVGDHHNS